MATGLTITGLLKNAKVRVEVLPERHVVAEFDRVSDQISLVLDPGHYVVANSRIRPKRHDNAKKVFEFFHDITPEAARRLEHANPNKFMKPVQTSDGAVWMCMFPGCDERVTGKNAALVHEAGHMGVDLLTVEGSQMEDALAEVKLHVEKTAAEMEEREDAVTLTGGTNFVEPDATVKPKRGPGRPKKIKVEEQ